LLLSSHVRQHSPVDALRTHHVDVIQFGQLLRAERLGGPEHHVPRIVHDDINAAIGVEDVFNRGIYGRLRLHIHFHSPQVDTIVLREVGDRFDLRGVAARGIDA
jgi:hypothetical protein